MNCVAGDEKHLLNAGSGVYILLLRENASLRFRIIG